jgi:hypothetical protein
VTEMHFEIAVADADSVANRDYFLTLFKLPGPGEGDPEETYAAVRPHGDAWLALSRTVFVAKRSQEDTLISGMKFLDQCLIESDLRKALIQAIEKDPEKFKAYRPDDEDELADPDLSDFGVLVSRSNQRLTDRLFDGDDRFGSATLVDVMQRLTQQWSANPTGSPDDSSSSPRKTGGRSTGSRSTAGSTSPKSSSRPRRASSA